MSTAAHHQPSVAGSNSILDRVYGERRFHLDGALLALAFTNESTLWSVEEPGILRSWEVASGKQLRRFILSDVETTWSFNRDASRLVSGSDDLSLWDVAAGQLIWSVEQAAWVDAAVFSPLGDFVASGHDDGTIRLWQSANPELIGEWKGHSTAISAMAISPDGSQLASAAEDRLISIWDVATGRKLGVLTGHTDRIHGILWHPNGGRLVSIGWDASPRVWDAGSFEPIVSLNRHSDQLTALAIDSRGRLACADVHNTLHLWNASLGKHLGSIQGHQGEVRCLAFSGDGRLLASGGDDRVIQLWDPHALCRVYGPGQTPVARSGVDVSADGKRVAGAVGGDRVTVWESETGREVISATGIQNPQLARFSPDGRWLAGSGSDSEIHIWDARTGAHCRNLAGQNGKVTALAFSPNGAVLASGSADDGLVWLWNMSDGEPRLVIPEAADNCVVRCLAFDPLGNILAAGGIDWLATSGSDGAICLWNVETRRLVDSLDGGTSALAYHSSGRWLAATGLENSIFVWDLTTREVAAELLDNSGVTTLAYSPDGSLLAAGSEDGRLQLWCTTDYEPIAAHVFASPIYSLCFSPDGRFIYAANGNATCCRLRVNALRAADPA